MNYQVDTLAASLFQAQACRSLSATTSMRVPLFPMLLMFGPSTLGLFEECFSPPSRQSAAGAGAMETKEGRPLDASAKAGPPLGVRVFGLRN